MSNRLSDTQLLQIITFSPTATAIYTTDDIIVETANEAMLALWGKTASVIGMLFNKAFPEIAGQNSMELLKEVWNSGITYHAKHKAFNIGEDGKPVTTYFDFSYRPIKDVAGRVYCILHTAVDITEQVQQTQALKALQSRQLDMNKELAASMEAYNKMELINKNFLSNSKHQIHTILKGPAALAIFSEPDLIIEFANEDILKMWGKSADIIGKPLLQVLPELEGQPYPAILQNVYTTGEAYFGNSEKVVLELEGRKEDRYFNFIYQPLKKIHGPVTGIMVVANDVTDQVIFRTNVQQLNSKLTIANEELNNVNQQLTKTNQDLQQSQAHLQTLYNQLEESESRFREVIKQAPVAIIIFHGPDMQIDTINAKMQELLQKDESITGQQVLIAVPELKNQKQYKLLHHVFISGRPVYQFDEPVQLKRNGTIETGYFNYSITPLVQGGKITGVINVAVEVTNQVKARQAIQQLNDALTGSNNKLHNINDELLVANDDLAAAQRNLKNLVEQLRESELNLHQAIQSGHVGTWSVDLATQKITVSNQCCQLFGLPVDQEISLEDVERAVGPVHFPAVLETLTNAIEKGADSDISYPIMLSTTQQQRWLRIIGKVYTTEKGKIYAGTVMDITEQKQDEQRKNDLLNMLSEELKTPLAATKECVQLLQKDIDKEDSHIAADILAKLDGQVDKIHTLIDAYL